MNLKMVCIYSYKMHDNKSIGTLCAWLGMRSLGRKDPLVMPPLGFSRPILTRRFMTIPIVFFYRSPIGMRHQNVHVLSESKQQMAQYNQRYDYIKPIHKPVQWAIYQNTIGVVMRRLVGMGLKYKIS